MISGRINLAQLKHVIQKQKGKTGMIEGVFIPIKINDHSSSSEDDNLPF